MSVNAWLHSQRKGELAELASDLGMKNYESLKKVDLETRIESFVLNNEASLVNNPRLANFWTSRARATGSPIKRESGPGSATASVAGDVKTPTSAVVRRRGTRSMEEPESTSSSPTTVLAAVRNPGSRALALASAHLRMPSTPVAVQDVVDRSIALVNDGVAAVQDSKLADATLNTRSALSTVSSIVASVVAFEAYFLRPAVLPDALWFTIPASDALQTPAVPIVLPNLKAALTCAFWGPVLSWLAVSMLAPLVLAFFFNLSSSSASSKRLRSKYAFDPLAFAIAKAVLSYVVFAQGATFNVMNPLAIDRINAVVYGGWQGMLVGAGIIGLSAFYEAILAK
ncbi:hypothetical protein TD95_004047 [Thielaviopsis punctulata]|uniref:Uncharacterized protein n=1 Tax=Thielaviopsis punctulata TaxID=72032 RepID=A0A0F4ZFM6_9PEZI|nr:hypothetical protein TD95_004047 [Thielaviopsis punctulata]